MLNRILVTGCLALISLFLSFNVWANENFVNRPDVQAFINKMVEKHGFKKAELSKIFDAVKVRPSVMHSVKAPLEAAPWYRYQALFLTRSRIEGGVKFWNQHEKLLEKAEKIYGVPASIIVATIGVETTYGKEKGEYPVIDALANIAFSDSRRSHYFRTELEEFLLLSREQHLNPLTIRGSYAGAIGQLQFMPSSYRYYAVNFSGNPRIDLSNNTADIIGSVANYYQKHGWKYNQPVAIPTEVQKSHFSFLSFFSRQKTLKTHADLAEYGIHPYQPIPEDGHFRVIQLQDRSGKEYWIGLHNFEVIKLYNPSDLYAMAVYQLSDSISDLREKSNHA